MTPPLAILLDDRLLLIEGGVAYDGVVEMLRGLRSAGYPLGVLVAGRSRTEWDRAEERLDLGPFEVVVVCEGEPAGWSPREAVVAAAGAVGVDADEIAFIASPRAVKGGGGRGVRVGVGLWVDGAGAYAGGGAGAEWRFERPADITRTFAAWC